MLFGVFDASEDNIILKHLILLAKFSMQIKYYLSIFKGICSQGKTTHQIERTIAFDKNKLSTHYKKWSKVLPCLT